jgi:protein TonB
MKSSIKLRSKPPVAIIPRVEDGPGVNDNVPAMLPGHQLSDLEGVPRQPAAESVVYYNRVTLIESFPAHPKQEPDKAADVPVMEAKREAKVSIVKPGKRRVAIACLCSFVFHAAVFAALVMTFVVTPEEPQEEAGEVVSVIMLGSDADEQAAGEESKEPEQVVADAVHPDTVQPTETKPEQVHPVEPQPTEAQPTEITQAVQPTEAQQPQPDEVQPAQPEVSQVSPETVVTPEPEVMASTAPAESTVVQPMATQVPETVQPEAQPPQPAEVQPSVQPVEAAEVQPEPQVPEEVVTPTEKPPVPKPPVEKPKVAAKKEPPKPEPPKQAKVKSGSRGQDEEDTKKGASTGSETAQSDQNSEGAANRSGWGSAAVANYPGKVQSRIRRSVRIPTEYKRMTGNLRVLVKLTINASGDVASLSLARSSGIPDLDQAVLDGVRRAAPFPSLPPEWGKPSWTFTQEVQVTGP